MEGPRILERTRGVVVLKTKWSTQAMPQTRSEDAPDESLPANRVPKRRPESAVPFCERLRQNAWRKHRTVMMTHSGANHNRDWDAPDVLRGQDRDHP
jgi:hypothetical protein